MHPNLLLQLKFKLLQTERNTMMRKIYEAYVVNHLNPRLIIRMSVFPLQHF